MSYYIQRKPTEDDQTPDVVDIEATFDGLYVTDVKNLTGKGSVKNRYIETFADKEEPLIYEPPISQGILYNSTSVSIILTILGETHVKTYSDFISYISARQFTFWDDLRNAKVDLILQDAVSPDDIHIAGSEMTDVEIKLTNLKGNYESIN